MKPVSGYGSPVVTVSVIGRFNGELGEKGEN